MKINGRIAASTFSSDSKRIYTSSGKFGYIYVSDFILKKIPKPALFSPYCFNKKIRYMDYI